MPILSYVPQATIDGRDLVLKIKYNMEPFSSLGEDRGKSYTFQHNSFVTTLERRYQLE